MKLHRAFLPVVVATAAFFSTHAAAVPPLVTPLLIIDDTNPAAVTITATDYNPFRADSAHTFGDGFDITNFFAVTTPTTATYDDPFSVIASTLTTSLPFNVTYNTAIQDDLTSGPPYEQDLNLYNSSDSNSFTENFSKSAPAFTGSITLDLSDVAQYLPAVGTIGAIYSGYSGDLTANSDEVQGLAALFTNYVMYLGDYEVVPEPSTWAMLLVGGLGLLALRRMRRA